LYSSLLSSNSEARTSPRKKSIQRSTESWCYGACSGSSTPQGTRPNHFSVQGSLNIVSSIFSLPDQTPSPSARTLSDSLPDQGHVRPRREKPHRRIYSARHILTREATSRMRQPTPTT